MSLYHRYAYLVDDDIRDDPTYRRRILNLLPCDVYSPRHDADYRDLNWRSRSAMMMLLSRMKIHQQHSRPQTSLNKVSALLVETLLDHK
jgi:hypothetical protein